MAAVAVCIAAAPGVVLQHQQPCQQPHRWRAGLCKGEDAAMSRQQHSAGTAVDTQEEVVVVEEEEEERMAVEFVYRK